MTIAALAAAAPLAAGGAVFLASGWIAETLLAHSRDDPVTSLPAVETCLD